MFGFKFPYSNFHELNLDYILEEISKLENKIELMQLEIKDAVLYMKENIVATTTTIIEQMIENGEISVAVRYTADEERLDIVVSGE